MNTIIEFDYKKATQAINYFAGKSGGTINKMAAIKLIWLADRYHLRKYGRPVIGDDYLAMSYGPVGSSIKDIAEGNDFLPPEEREYRGKYLEKADKYVVKSIAPVDDEVFSETDLEALDFAFKKFGHLNRFRLVEISHNYPEWTKFKAELESGSTREKMSYLDFFEDPPQYPNDPFKLDKELLELNKETFSENFEAAKDWL